MTQTAIREASAELSQRIEGSRIDPADIDEAGRPPSDKPPAFAEALMSEAPISVEHRAKLSAVDWEVINEALKHYASCGK